MEKKVKEFLGKVDTDIFRQILQFNLNVTNEKILVLGDTGYNGNVISPVISNAYQQAAEDLGFDSELMLESPTVKGESADEEVIKKIGSLPNGSIIIMNMSRKLGKLDGLGLSFRKFCRKNNHRFISASSLGVIKNEQIKDIINAYDVDYEALSKKANRIKKVFDEADELHITTKTGTDLKFNVKSMEAVVSDGIYREPGEGGNLPGTETYMPPRKDNVEGKIVIDGSMRTRKGTHLVKNPIEMTIRKGAIVAMNDNEESRLLEETLRWAHKKAKYPWGVRRIAEFGIGLNPKAKVIGCTVVDEKTLGTGHFAIGSNYWFGGSIYAIIHLDQVFRNPTIKADGKKVTV